MRDSRIFFDGSERVYIRISEDIKFPCEVTLLISKDLISKTIKIVAVDNNESLEIPIKSNCHESECNNCHVVYCPVYQDHASIFTVGDKNKNGSKDEKDDIILGHPNCHQEDCKNCHNVSCSIHYNM